MKKRIYQKGNSFKIKDDHCIMFVRTNVKSNLIEKNIVKKEDKYKVTFCSERFKIKKQLKEKLNPMLQLRKVLGNVKPRNTNYIQRDNDNNRYRFYLRIGYYDNLREAKYIKQQFKNLYKEL